MGTGMGPVQRLKGVFSFMAFFRFRWPGRQSSQPPRGGIRPALAPAQPTQQSDPVEQMRRRERHRLLGAAVLVLAGIVGFPLLFDTQPRTMPSPQFTVGGVSGSNQESPLSLPPMATADDSLAAGEEIVTAGAVPAVAEVEVPPSPVLPDLPDAPAPLPPLPTPNLEPILVPESVPTSAAPAQVESPSNGQPSQSAAKKPATQPAAKVTEAERERARALLEGKPVLSAEEQRVQALLEQRPVAAAKVPKASRFVLQVGSFSDAAGAQNMRERLQKAGINAYLEEVNVVNKGTRTRVRVGPLTTQAETDKMEKRIKDMGLPAVPIVIP